MGHILSSTLARSKSGTCIAAYLNLREPNSRPHVGLVNFYFEHTIQSNSMGHTENSTQTMSLVQWFKDHPDRDLIQHPLEIWEDSFMVITKTQDSTGRDGISRPVPSLLKHGTRGDLIHLHTVC